MIPTVVDHHSSTGSGESSGRSLTTRASITRAFTDQSLRVGTTFEIPPDQRHHFKHVLRAQPGDVFEIVSQDRSSFIARVVSDYEAFVVEETSGSGSHHVELELYQAVPKGKRMELVVEKAVEVGVTRVIPLLTDRSVVKAQEGNKLERWRRISESAARQALREEVPEISSPVDFAQAVAGGGVMLHNGDGLPMLEEISAVPDRLFVGPEGGWSEGEMDLASRSGVVLASLGGYRLRSETAGIVGVVRARAVLDRLKADGTNETRTGD